MKPIHEFLQLPWGASTKESSMRLHPDNYDHDAFSDFIAKDPTTETQMPASEWEVLRYRREEFDGPPNGEEKATGVYLYGIVYRNKKGRITLTGEAIRDYKEFSRGQN